MRLTRTPTYGFSPDWSPSGRRIAFQTGDGIKVMSLDGTKEWVVRGTSNSTYLGWRDHPRIVFARGSVDGGDIFTITPDGSDRRRLTLPHDGEEDHPRWEPGGRWIAFQRVTGVGEFDLFTMNPNGSSVHRLTRPSTRLRDLTAKTAPSGGMGSTGTAHLPERSRWRLRQGRAGSARGRRGP